MSAVYRVHQDGLDRTVALKMLHPHLVTERTSLERFLQEARAESSIAHPNVVSVQAMGTTEEGHLFLVMDYLEGQSLAEVVKEKSRLPESDATAVFLQICAGLEAAHKSNILHRDLKPSNVMLVGAGDDACVKIVDFGIAKALGADEQSITKAGSVLGSPTYMSPEQCQGSALDFRSDIYSMGCLMYEVVAGKAPFEADSELETMVKHVNEAPPPFTSIAPDAVLSSDLQRIILRCLEKQPSARYQSINELRTDLEHCATNADPTATALNMQGVPLQSNARPGITRTNAIIAAACSVSAVVLIGGLLFFGPSGSATQLQIAVQMDKWRGRDKTTEHLFRVAELKWVTGHQDEAREMYAVMLKAVSEPGFDSRIMDAHTTKAFRTQVIPRSDEKSLKPLMFAAASFLKFQRLDLAQACYEHAYDLASKKVDRGVEARCLIGLSKIELKKEAPASMKSQMRARELIIAALPKFRESSKPISSEVLFELHDLASILSNLNNPVAAGDICEIGVRLADELGSRNGITSILMFDRAYMYRRQQKYAEAQPWYERCLELRKQILAADDPSLAMTYQDTASNLQSQGRYTDALPLHQQALRLWELSPKTSWNTNFAPHFASIYCDIGDCYARVKRHSDSQQLYERSVRICQLSARGPGLTVPPIVSERAIKGLVGAYEAQGKQAEAKQLLQVTWRPDQAIR
jgi:serine/threonine protein kinase/tetratricopeptide (TPR) repeat protein